MSKDKRPICYCPAYGFPHKIGGKCKGTDFADFHFSYIKSSCGGCNALNEIDSITTCDVADGIENINEAECYQDRLSYHPGERLPLDFDFEFERDEPDHD